MPPFARILVPFDGSEPARAALEYAIALGREGARLDVVDVVDATDATGGVIDPTPLRKAMDEQAAALLESAMERCRDANVAARCEIVHGATVPGIVAAARRAESDLIVIGAHARHGLARAFLGSTALGVLRSSETPILAVRSAGPAFAKPLFKRVLVAVDDSDPSRAACAVAQRVVEAMHAETIACHVVDTRHLHDMSLQYGYDPRPFLDELFAQARATVDRAIERGLPKPTIEIVEGEPAAAILQAVEECQADLIVIGSHGRRGLRRLLLGSVAEHVVRAGTVPVLVVRR